MCSFLLVYIDDIGRICWHIWQFSSQVFLTNRCHWSSVTWVWLKECAQVSPSKAYGAQKHLGDSSKQLTIHPFVRLYDHCINNAASIQKTLRFTAFSHSHIVILSFQPGQCLWSSLWPKSQTVHRCASFESEVVGWDLNAGRVSNNAGCFFIDSDKHEDANQGPIVWNTMNRISVLSQRYTTPTHALVMFPGHATRISRCHFDCTADIGVLQPCRQGTGKTDNYIISWYSFKSNFVK